MNKVVNGYLDFINESKLELLLEAKIQFMPKFNKLINRIDSPITDALFDIEGTEVDVNTNYIDISDDNYGYITFVPDDKVSGVNYVVTGEPYNTYYSLSLNARHNKTYPIGHVDDPKEGTIGQIIHQPTIEELNKILPSPNWDTWSEDDRLVHFQFNDGKSNIFIKKSGLRLDVSNYKSTDYRVGKFITSILKKAGYDFTPVEIEDFVSKYKAQMKLISNTLSRFEIVKGEEIRKYYLVDNYFSKTKGTLGTSCMKHKYCQPYFDIYVNNPEQVSMVILRQEEGYVEDYVDEDTGEILTLPVEDKITGRAILWTDNKGRKVMDRIYVNDHSDIEFFKEFAIKNEFLYKKDQDFNEDTPFMLNNSQLSKEESSIVVQLPENTAYDSYPYMDTLKCYTIKTGILTNIDPGYQNRDFYLEDTDGGMGPCSFCGGEGELDCPECLGVGIEECPDCEGVRRETCDFCHGVEKLPCPSCDGNDPECDMCKGKGEVYCPECGGEGLLDCETCGGSGDIQCSMCKGHKMVDCPECG